MKAGGVHQLRTLPSHASLSVVARSFEVSRRFCRVAWHLRRLALRKPEGIGAYPPRGAVGATD